MEFLQSITFQQAHVEEWNKIQIKNDHSIHVKWDKNGNVKRILFQTRNNGCGILHISGD